MSKLTITTIKPTSGLYASFQPRSKEGEEKKPEVFASYEIPACLSGINNDDARAFAIRAYGFAVAELLKAAVKDGKPEFSVAFPELFGETKREFLVTKKDLEAWIDNFASGIISAALVAKSGLPADSVKIVKKVLAYKALLLEIASRSIMMQEQIDSCIKVLSLIAESGKTHAYTDNVAEGLSRKQDKLNAYLAGNQQDEEDDLDL